jgi:hypothetical protein
MNTKMLLQAAFPVCPECSAPWDYHFSYTRDPERGLLRLYNTCGLSRAQLEAKYLRGKSS